MDYDYREAVKDDVLQYLENEDPSCLEEEDRDDVEEKLNELLWVEDSVTGNASGSYYCNSWEAEEAIAHNWDLLAEVCSEYCIDNPIEQGAEYCDVSIRCYVLGEAISAALDEFESEHPEKCGWIEKPEEEDEEEEDEEIFLPHYSNETNTSDQQ